MQDPIANTEYIDPSNVDTSSVGNKVPLEPLPLSGNSEPESVPPGKGDVDFGNLNQDGNETHTEPN